MAASCIVRIANHYRDQTEDAGKHKKQQKKATKAICTQTGKKS
jgi:hypothetical protein